MARGPRPQRSLQALAWACLMSLALAAPPGRDAVPTGWVGEIWPYSAKMTFWNVLSVRVTCAPGTACAAPASARRPLPPDVQVQVGPASAALGWQPNQTAERPLVTAELVNTGAASEPWTFQLSNLAPGAEYHVCARGRPSAQWFDDDDEWNRPCAAPGEAGAHRRFQLRTAPDDPPRPSARRPVVLAFGSGDRFSHEADDPARLRVFRAIASELQTLAGPANASAPVPSAGLFVHLGGLHHARPEGPAQAAWYTRALQQTLAAAPFQHLLRRVPMRYVWGPSDYDAEQPNGQSPRRPAALAAFRQATPQTAADPAADRPVYQAFTLDAHAGGGPAGVRLVLLDVVAGAAPEDPEDAACRAPLLDEVQLAWLLQEVDQASAYLLLVVVSPLPLSGPVRGMGTWRQCEAQRARLLARAQNHTNILVVAGGVRMLAFDDGSRQGLPVLQAGPLGDHGSVGAGDFTADCHSFLLSPTQQFGVVRVWQEAAAAGRWRTVVEVRGVRTLPGLDALEEPGPHNVLGPFEANLSGRPDASRPWMYQGKAEHTECSSQPYYPAYMKGPAFLVLFLQAFAVWAALLGLCSLLAYCWRQWKQPEADKQDPSTGERPWLRLICTLGFVPWFILCLYMVVIPGANPGSAVALNALFRDPVYKDSYEVGDGYIFGFSGLVVLFFLCVQAAGLVLWALVWALRAHCDLNPCNCLVLPMWWYFGDLNPSEGEDSKTEQTETEDGRNSPTQSVEMQTPRTSADKNSPGMPVTTNLSHGDGNSTGQPRSRAPTEDWGK